MIEPTTQLVPPSTDAPSADEGCPTPLAWQQVLDEVRRERQIQAVEVGSTTLTAAVIGNGRPLYLLPGFFGDHELGVLTAWLLREEMTCVLIDPPRIAARERHSPDFLLHEWAAAVVAMADHLGHEVVSLYGPNFGGLIALQTMLDAPHRISSATLQCAFAKWQSSVAERMLTAIAGKSDRPLGSWSSFVNVQERNHRRWFPPFDETRWEFYAANVAATSAREAARRVKVAAGVNLSSQLPQIQQPVLVIATEGDGSVATQSQEDLAAGLPNVQRDSLDNCGRLPHISHPHRLVKLLRQYQESTT